MNWLQKLCQVNASDLPFHRWFHGIDTASLYQFINEMVLKPRSETGVSQYTGHLSSLPDAVYLTPDVGMAIRYAFERTKGKHRYSSPVIVVVNNSDLSLLQIDEDFIHQVLLGEEQAEIPNKLRKQIFEMAAEIMGIWEGDAERQVSQQVAQYQQYGGNEDFTDEDMEEMGIVPDEEGLYGYDAIMDISKYIANELGPFAQGMAIAAFQAAAHLGPASISEVYRLPLTIKKQGLDGPYEVDVRDGISSYDELKKYCERIDPRQLLMSFLKQVPEE